MSWIEFATNLGKISGIFKHTKHVNRNIALTFNFLLQCSHQKGMLDHGKPIHGRNY